MKPLTTVYREQDELLLALMKVHGIEQWDVDPTFGSGGFYRSGKIALPEYRFDLKPRFKEVAQADCRDLPLLDESVGSILFDPPFLHAHGKASVMGRQYDSYPSQKALQEMYCGALKEFRRVLRPNGFLAFKHMNVVESGKQVWTSHWLWMEATLTHGYVQKDEAILVSESRMEGWNHKRQRHLRKYHCTFALFQRPRT